MYISSPEGQLAVNNEQFLVAQENVGRLSVRQTHELARQAGFPRIFETSTSWSRMLFRYLGRRAEDALLQADPDLTVYDARDKAGYDGPIEALYQGWTLGVADRLSDDEPYDLGVRLIMGMRPVRTSAMIRVPLVMGLDPFRFKNKDELPVNILRIGWNLTTGHTEYGERAVDIAAVAHRFLDLVSDKSSIETNLPEDRRYGLLNRSLRQHGLGIPDSGIRPI